MQEKNKFMNAQSKRILNRKPGLQVVSDVDSHRSGFNRKSKSRKRNKHLATDNNDDLNDIFSLKDEEFANMGYVDSMKMQEMQRFNIKENKEFQVKTEIARPYITREIEMRDRIGPY